MTKQELPIEYNRRLCCSASCGRISGHERKCNRAAQAGDLRTSYRRRPVHGRGKHSAVWDGTLMFVAIERILVREAIHE